MTATSTGSTDHTPQLGKVRHANLSPAELYEHAIRREEGVIVNGGPLVVRTGKHTGRSPQDKFIVDEPDIHDKVWWGGFNKPISIERYEALRARIFDHLDAAGRSSSRRASWAPTRRYRRSLRAYTETAWASIFCDNLFIRPRAGRPGRLRAQLHDRRRAQSSRPTPPRDGTRTETVILVHLTRQEILIGGTEYAGEIKKGAFGIMNYRLPDEGVLPMHSLGQRRARTATWPSSSACRAPARRPSRPTRSGRSSATTSTAGAPRASSTSRAAATPRRSACRTSTSRTSTPRRAASARSSRTWSSTRRPASWTSTPRRSPRTPARAFPLDFISNSSDTGMAGHPSNVIFLTADAFGVLPPISRLTRDQAMYHFISGYTAKLAGTEVGVKEPSATFSLCFGAPFMPRHPAVYAQMLGEKLDRYDVPGLAGQHRLDRRPVRRRASG